MTPEIEEQFKIFIADVKRTELDDETKEKAVAGLQRMVEDEAYYAKLTDGEGCTVETLGGAFVWGYTDEGHAFWHLVDNAIDRLPIITPEGIKSGTSWGIITWEQVEAALKEKQERGY